MNGALWATAALLIASTPALAETASWYGGIKHHGQKTASGERFNQHAFTAAHRTLPFGTKVRVSHAGKSIVVRINDRGPFVKGRSIDLSRAAFARIASLKSGVIRVSIR